MEIMKYLSKVTNFLRPHLDYGDIIYDQAHNLSFHQKLESIQYNAALAFTSLLAQGKSCIKSQVQSLFNCGKGIGSYAVFYKIYNKQTPDYLTELVPTHTEAYQTRHFAIIPSLSFKHNFFKNTFFSSTILEWNKLDPSL